MVLWFCAVMPDFLSLPPALPPGIGALISDFRAKQVTLGLDEDYLAALPGELPD
jgi:hypothetical protein